MKQKIPGKGLTSRIYKELQVNNKNNRIGFLNMGKLKDAQHHQLLRECKSKTTMKSYFIFADL